VGMVVGSPPGKASFRLSYHQVSTSALLIFGAADSAFSPT
jgi:hypothetical protein